MSQTEDRWSPLLKNMEDSPGLLVSQEPVKELIAQVRRLKDALEHCGGYLMTALPVNQPEWLAGIPEIIAEADAALKEKENA